MADANDLGLSVSGSPKSMKKIGARILKHIKKKKKKKKN
jgi:hypothetical protein